MTANNENGTQTMMIGRTQLKLPADHHLPKIMEKHRQYDYLYWNMIQAVISDNGVASPGLIDIGANFGDTICHFKRFSSGPAWGIEPDPIYFDFLKQNTTQFRNVRTTQALVSPENLIGKEIFTTSHGTGATSLSGDGEVFRGARLTTQEVVDAIT